MYIDTSLLVPYYCPGSLESGGGTHSSFRLEPHGERPDRSGVLLRFGEKGSHERDVGDGRQADRVTVRRPSPGGPVRAHRDRASALRCRPRLACPALAATSGAGCAPSRRCRRRGTWPRRPPTGTSPGPRGVSGWPSRCFLDGASGSRSGQGLDALLGVRLLYLLFRLVTIGPVTTGFPIGFNHATLGVSELCQRVGGPDISGGIPRRPA